jgi:hypothetical protein
MRTKTPNSWVRMVLAFAAVLLVAGAGMSLAAGPTNKYAIPIAGRITVTPYPVPTGTTATLDLLVTFKNPDNSLETDVSVDGDATFSASKGSVSGQTYTAPGTTGFDAVTAVYTFNGQTVTAHRLVQNT